MGRGRKKRYESDTGTEDELSRLIGDNPGDGMVRFFEECLVHIKGERAGSPFVLEPWQERFTRKLFGTLRADGSRQYRKAALWVPRKNGKSTWAAGISLGLLAEGEPGAEVYNCGLDRGQARIVHDLAKSMVMNSPRLSKIFQIYRDAIVNPRTSSVLAPLSADAASHLGKNAHGVVFDEIGFAQKRDFFDVMATSMGARRNPLLVEISTAGVFDPEAFGWQEYDRCRKVLEGLLEDPELLCEIYGLELEDDWLDPDNWRKANPNVDVSFPMSFLEAQFLRARETLSEQNSARMYFLNQWQQQTTRWLDLHAYDANDGEPEIEDGAVCYGGLDLGSTRDLTALVLIFPRTLVDGTEVYDILPRFYLPENKARNAPEAVDYEAWRQAGLICLTPGDATDYQFVRRDLALLGEKYDVRTIAFDRWGAAQISQQLTDDGFDLVQFGQGFASMSMPTKELERLVIAGRLRHGGNPVLRWNAANATVKIDAHENVKIVKDRSSGRVDGLVALVMALAMTQTAVDTTSIYESRGLLSL